jgi:hypothetical protein
MAWNNENRRKVDDVGKAVQEAGKKTGLSVVQVVLTSPNIEVRRLLLSYANNLINSYARQHNSLYSNPNKFRQEREHMQSRVVDDLDSLRIEKSRYQYH